MENFDTTVRKVDGNTLGNVVGSIDCWIDAIVVGDKLECATGLFVGIHIVI